jgi:selenocysteine-specific elongation factor
MLKLTRRKTQPPPHQGLQAQTAECLVVGEMAAQHLVIALNKTDLLPAAERPKAIKKAQKRLAAVFASTRFAGAPMVPVCGRPGGAAAEGTAEPAEAAASSSSSSGGAAGSGGKQGGGNSSDPSSSAASSSAATAAAQGIEELRSTLLRMAAPRVADGSAPFLFAVDHCFAIKGQGTVLTGTVLQGAVEVNGTVELPALKISRQVRERRFLFWLVGWSPETRFGL